MAQQSGSEAIAVVIEKLTEIVQTSKSSDRQSPNEGGQTESPILGGTSSLISGYGDKVLIPNRSEIEAHLLASREDQQLSAGGEKSSSYNVSSLPLVLSPEPAIPGKRSSCIKLVTSTSTVEHAEQDHETLFARSEHELDQAVESSDLSLNSKSSRSLGNVTQLCSTTGGSHIIGVIEENVPESQKSLPSSTLQEGLQARPNISQPPVISISSSTIAEANQLNASVQNANAALVSNENGQQVIVNLPANLGKLNITNAKTLLESLIQLNSSLLKGEGRKLETAVSPADERSQVIVSTAPEVPSTSTSVDKEVFKCAKCDYSSTNKNYLKQHVELRHNSERPFKCPFCDYAGKRSHSLKEHLVVHSTNRPYVCSMCNATFRKKGHLTNHIRLHSSQKMFTCNLCQARFQDRNDLYSHLRTIHSPEDVYACENCIYATTIKSNIVMHMHTHGNPKTFKCNVCSFTALHINIIKHHLSVHSGIATYQVETSTAEPRPVILLKCSECGFTSDNKDTLKTHMWEHVEGHEEMETSSPGEPDVHKVLEAAESTSEAKKPKSLYRCSWCSYQSAEAYHFITHILSHKPLHPKQVLETMVESTVENSSPNTAEKTAAESKSPEESSAESGRHFTHDSYVGMYRCTICGYTCEQQRTIKAHIWRHSGHKDMGYPMFRNGPLSMYDDMPLDSKPVLLDPTGDCKPGAEMVKVPIEKTRATTKASEGINAPALSAPEGKCYTDGVFSENHFKSSTSETLHSNSSGLKLVDLLRRKGPSEAVVLQPQSVHVSSSGEPMDGVDSAPVHTVSSADHTQVTTTTSWDSQSLQQMVNSLAPSMAPGGQVVIVMEDSDQHTVEYTVPIHVTDAGDEGGRNESIVPPPMLIAPNYSEDVTMSRTSDMQEVVVSVENCTEEESQLQLDVSTTQDIEGKPRQFSKESSKAHASEKATSEVHVESTLTGSPAGVNRQQTLPSEIVETIKLALEKPIGKSLKQDTGKCFAPNDSVVDITAPESKSGVDPVLPSNPQELPNSENRVHYDTITTVEHTTPSGMSPPSMSTSLAEANPEIVQLIMKGRTAGVSPQNEFGCSENNTIAVGHDPSCSAGVNIVTDTLAVKTEKAETAHTEEQIVAKRKCDAEEDGSSLSKRLCQEGIVTTSSNVVVQRLPQSYTTPTFGMYDSHGNSPRTRSPNPDAESSQEESCGEAEHTEGESDYQHETVVEIHHSSGDQQPEVANHEDVDEPEPMVTLLSLLKKGPNYNPACPVTMVTVQADSRTEAMEEAEMIKDGASDCGEGNSGSKPKQGICSSLLAVIEQLRERSKSESEGEDSREGTRDEIRDGTRDDIQDNTRDDSRPSTKTTSRRRSQRNSEEDDLSLENYENVELVEEGSYRCKLCHYTSSGMAMKSHQRLHKIKQPHECSLCSFMGESSEQLQDHMLQHCKVRTYHCKICPTVFNYKSQLRAHMRAHNEKDPFLCDLCDFETTNPIGFRSHIRMHRNHSSYGCMQCEESFANAEDLAAHNLTCGTSEDTSLSTEDSESLEQSRQSSGVKQSVVKMYKCEECEFTSASVNTMRAHCRNHLTDDDTPLRCELCDFTAISSRSLKSHMKRHVNDQRFVQQPLEQYKCNLCGYVCHHLPSLKSHMWRHASDQNYSYQLANNIINAAIDYDTKPTPPTPVVASVGKPRTAESLGNTHTPTEAGQTGSGNPCFITFRCCQCGFESMDKGALGIHMKTHLDIIKKTLDVTRPHTVTLTKSDTSDSHESPVSPDQDISESSQQVKAK